MRLLHTQHPNRFIDTKFAPLITVHLILMTPPQGAGTITPLAPPHVTGGETTFKAYLPGFLFSLSA